MMNCDPVDDELDGSVKLENSWICKLCGKEFGSGKALGGHMRVHKQEEPGEKKSDDDGMKEYLDCLVKDGKPTCPICNKSFTSLKSLFGHMRCHPDRKWRGMKPPKIRVSKSLSSPNSAAVDLMECLPGWSVKARRCCGRSTIVNDDEILEEAVHGLMKLANGKSCYHTKCYSYSICNRKILEEDYDEDDIVMQPPASSSSSKSLLEEGEVEKAILCFDLNELPNEDIDQ